MNSDQQRAIALEANRLSVAAEVIMFEAAERMAREGLSPNLSVTSMAFSMFSHFDQLSAGDQLALLSQLQTFIDERYAALDKDPQSFE